MNNKTLLSGIVGVLITLVVGYGAVKVNPDLVPVTPTPVVTPVDPAVTPVTPVIPVTPEPADPNAAKVVIKAPASVKAGDLVVLDVSGSNAMSFAWKVVPETANFLVIDGGKRAVFSNGTGGDFLFIVSAAKGDTVDVKTHTVKVDGPDGTPAPTDIASKVAAWCEPVESPTKRDEALKLAQSFSSVAAVITPAMTPEDIGEATKKSNRDALGENVTKWEPFLISLMGELQSQAEAGNLPDTEAHAKAWRSIAEGLKRYADTL